MELYEFIRAYVDETNRLTTGGVFTSAFRQDWMEHRAIRAFEVTTDPTHQKAVRAARDGLQHLVIEWQNNIDEAR